ncbi:MAG: endonuclease [Flavobacterium sp.]
MKKTITLLLLSFTFLGIAQDQPANTTLSANSIPAGYYNSATGTGYVLKTQLFNIIKNHIDRTYSGLYTTFQTSDVKPNGKVWDVYSNCDFTFGTVDNGGNQDNGTNPGGECVFFNREHTVPQSYFNSQTPMYSDAHFVLPTDKVVNATRDDWPFGKVQNATYTSGNGSKLGNNLNSGYSAGYTSTVFEPVDEYKGDIARVLLYFATRYEDQVADFYTAAAATSKIKPMFDGSSNRVFSQTFLNILLTWNIQDPVSAKEIARNDAIYARQNNRNPYIDHNEYVAQIWGAPLAIPGFDYLSSVSVYPNPTSDVINISTEIALDEIDIITINGQVLQQIKKPVFENNTYSISNLPKGFYFLKLSSETSSVTKKVLIN